MRVLSYSLALVLLLAVCVILYGWVTDCKDTRGVYTYCFPGDGR